MASRFTTTEDLVKVADAIRSKTGKSELIAYPEGFVQDIESIKVGEDGVPIPVSNEVQLQELLADSENLGKIIEWQGVLYELQDGGQDEDWTVLYIRIPSNSEPTRGPPVGDVELHYYQSDANGIEVDWGDGTPTEMYGTAGDAILSHTYSLAGEYGIKFMVRSGTGAFKDYVLTDSLPQRNFPISLHLGKDFVEVSGSAFRNCGVFREVYIPEGFATIGAYAFQSTSIEYVHFPLSVESLGNYCFRSCTKILSVSLDGSCILNPYVFYNCSSILELHLKSSNPPSIVSVTALSISDKCVIYVPKGSLETYQNATNWSVYASQMREEE